MFKMILPLMMVFSVGAHAKSLKSVDACVNDSYVAEQIREIDASERLDIFNAQGDIVGALIFRSGGLSGGLAALYLCGSNSGYYYADGEIADWITHIGREVPIGSIYNDEYDVEAKAQTLNRDEKSTNLKIHVKAQFAGDSEYADYEPFSAEIFVKVPHK
ncbi:hypothetical protein [Bdellovibrio sp. HCB-110]|uniref:hypothetical protein n=1 Tax=Bdellovibrio sp. HCB-110 TaxID=3391182 RepID=UPI0039B669EB